jgi:HD superfamily phosphohydrolase
MKNSVSIDDFRNKPEVLDHFAVLDDYDILSALKVWQNADDPVLSDLSQRILDRNLFKIEFSKKPFDTNRIASMQSKVKAKFGVSDVDIQYYVYTDVLTNNAYNEGKQNINLLMKSGEILDISKASDNLNISALSKPVEKYFLSYPQL